MPLSLAWNRRRHEIDDEIGLHVEKEESAIDEPVLESFRQRRQCRQHVPRHAAERLTLRVDAVDFELDRTGPGAFVPDAAARVLALLTPHLRRGQLADPLLDRRREDVAGLGAGALGANP